MRALVLAGLVVAAAADARQRKPRATHEGTVLATGKRTTGAGQVTYLTSDGVYIDRGSAEGLKPGDKVQMVRSGRALGSCAVTTVSEHSAVCSGTGFALGDRISVERKPEAPATPLAPVPDVKEIAHRLEVVEAAPVELVDFVGGAPVGSGAASTFAVTISHMSASNFGSDDGPYHVQRIDAAVRDFHVWRGLHVSADVSAVNWAQRPADFRSPLKGSPQLFVRQLEVSWHEPGSIWRAALGRLWTRGTPGLSTLDGAQGGLVTRDGRAEAGVYGGALPEPYNLGLSNGSWAAGAYGFGRFFWGQGADAIWLQPELRAGWSNRTGVGGRLEIAASLHGWVGRNFDLHLMAQGGVGDATALDLARVDLGVRGGERFRLLASMRYRGMPGGELIEPGALMGGARAIHADGQVFLELNPSLVVVVVGGWARDWDTGLESGRVGPELQLPRLFGRGGLAIGYGEELGWIRGRTAYVQATLVPHWRVRIIARATGHNYNSPSDGLSGSEVGGYASVEARFATFLWMRVNGLIRTRVDGTGTSGQAGASLGVEL